MIYTIIAVVLGIGIYSALNNWSKISKQNKKIKQLLKWRAEIQAKKDSGEDVGNRLQMMDDSINEFYRTHTKPL